MRLKKKHNRSAFKQVREVKGEKKQLKHIGRTSKQRLLAVRTCGKHYSLVTAQGFNKDELPHGCHVCPNHLGRGATQPASDHVHTAVRISSELFPGARIIFEARVIKGFNGGVDITIEYKDSRGETKEIDIEVDGEQHFKKQYHKTSAQEQREIDERKDTMALEQGRRLVRLHYNDRNRWGDTLKMGRKLAESNRNQNWILYSLSYGKKNEFRRR
jgi:hypothetical protein